MFYVVESVFYNSKSQNVLLLLEHNSSRIFCWKQLNSRWDEGQKRFRLRLLALLKHKLQKKFWSVFEVYTNTHNVYFYCGFKISYTKWRPYQATGNSRKTIILGSTLNICLEIFGQLWKHASKIHRIERNANENWTWRKRY